MILPRFSKALNMNFHPIRAAYPQDDIIEEEEETPLSDQDEPFPIPTPSGEIPGYNSPSVPANTITSPEPVALDETTSLLDAEPSSTQRWSLPNTSPTTSIAVQIFVLILSLSILALGGFYLRRAYRRRKLRQMLRQDMYDLGDDALPTARPGMERKSSLASPLRKMRRSEKAVRWGSEDSWKAEPEGEKGEQASESDDETLGRGYGLRRS